MQPRELFQFILKKQGITCPYQVWAEDLVNNNLECIDKQGDEYIQLFINFKDDDKPICLNVDNEKKQTTLLINYHKSYRIIIFLSDVVYFEEEFISVLYHVFYPYYANSSSQLKEERLEKIIESTRNITSSLNLDEVLFNIVQSTLSVIPSASFCILWMYDPDVDRIICRAFDGEVTTEIKKVQYRIGEGIVGKVFVSGKPKLYTAEQEFTLDVANLTPEQIQHFLAAYDLKRLKSCMAMPIFIQGKPECIMIIYQLGDKPKLNEDDMKILQVFSDQVAIAITNARMYDSISSKNHILTKRDEIHKTLVQISLKSSGLGEITHTLSKLLQMKLYFVDMINQEYYLQNKNMPSELSISELFKLFQKNMIPQHVQSSRSKKVWYICPILSEINLLGCLIIECGRQLTPLESITLEQGELILALEMVKQQALIENQYKKDYENFKALLDNNPKIISQLEINQNAYFVCTIFEFISYSDRRGIETQVQRLTAWIKNKAGDICLMVFGYHNRVILLSMLATQDQLTAYISQLKCIIKQSELYINLSLHAGMSSLHKGVGTIRRTYEEAEKVISSRLIKNPSELILYSEIGINKLFLNQSREEIEAFVQEIFEPLSSSKNTKSNLVETLMEYIRLNRSPQRTAESMFIHINTLYQRIRKIEQCLNISLDDPDDCLRIMLACYLKRSNPYSK